MIPCPLLTWVGLLPKTAHVFPRPPAGQVHALDAPGDLLEGSLGMLGIVTEVTLQVVPARKVAVRQLQVGEACEVRQGLAKMVVGGGGRG
jgi:FAD/FMN-containing dehydrogenase